MSHYVIPGGGLCNRLRVIKSVIEITNDLNVQVKVLWRVNEELGCSYHSLFKYEKKSNRKFDVININKIHPLYWLLHPKLLNIYKYLISFIADRCKIIMPEDTKLCVEKGFLPPGKSIIYSYHKFAQFNNLNEFSPIWNIQKQIDKIAVNFDEYTIGVHIRRTDNEEAIRMSPLSLFISRMEELILENSSHNFFLCTDDPAVKKEFLEKFPNKLQTRDILFNRDNEKGIEDAVVDLYLLANTRQLLCSHYSSFSETAILLGYKSKKVEVVQINFDEVQSQSV